MDTEGPDPFYKGPLIFPIMVPSIMIIASLPACKRLISPPEGNSWRLDGEGFPLKTLVVLGEILETRLRESLSIGEGNPLIFFTRPISLALIILTILIAAVPVYKDRRRARQEEVRVQNRRT